MGLIVLYALVNILVVSPAGNFPVNDDWVYSQGVFDLLKTGHFHLLCASAACYLHIGMGALVCSIFGASHVVLRALTVGMAFVAVVGLFFSLRRVGASGETAGLLTLLLASNPLFVHLSYTFMTDISALAFAGLYILLVLSGMRQASAWRVALAGIMLCCAVSIRQTWVLCVACNVALLGGMPSRKVKAWLLGAAVLAPIAVAIVTEKLFAIDNTIAGPYMWQRQQMLSTVHQLIVANPYAWGFTFERLAGIFSYFGLFCLPLVPPIVLSIASSIKRRDRLVIISLVAATSLAVVAAGYSIIVQHRLMPFSENLLRFPVVGPINIMGVSVDGLHSKKRLWLTIISALLSVPIIAIAVEAISRAMLEMVDWLFKRRNTIDWQSVFSASILCVSLAWLGVYTAVADFDRYYLMAFPALLICIGMRIRAEAIKKCLFVSIILLLLLAAYSTLAAQDYLSWNRARWNALHDLEHMGISPSSIDGGPEYNYWVNPQLSNDTSLGTTYSITHRGEYPRCNWRWWSVSGEQYIISFSPIPGYNVIGRYPFFGGLTMCDRDVLVLKHGRGTGK